MSEQPCAIWPDFEANVAPIPRGDGTFLDNIQSERAGGPYSIEDTLYGAVKEMDDPARARLTTWLVDQRQQGVYRPIVTQEVIEYARTMRPLSVDERAERLLRYLGEVPAPIGESLTVRRTPLLACTESTNIREVVYLEDYLAEQGWISGRAIAGPENLVATVTVDGHRRIANQAVNTEPAQAFVAMWFHESTASAYSEGVEPAIRDAGYLPLRIDRTEHINRIEDEIIAQIRRSRFVVADFTQGDDGARGGVYYEAGFAHGLRLPVILTCHENSLANLHFDTSHYNHIVWTNPNDLREKLRNRILAVIGEGPESNQGN